MVPVKNIAMIIELSFLAKFCLSQYYCIYCLHYKFCVCNICSANNKYPRYKKSLVKARHAKGCGVGLEKYYGFTYIKVNNHFVSITPLDDTIDDIS